VYKVARAGFAGYAMGNPRGEIIYRLSFNLAETSAIVRSPYMG